MKNQLSSGRTLMDISNLLRSEQRREQERARLFDGDVIPCEAVDDGFVTKEELEPNYHFSLSSGDWVKIRSPTAIENAQRAIEFGKHKLERLDVEIKRLQNLREKTQTLISECEAHLKS